MEAVTESVTKNRQTTETLRAMVSRAFGEHQIPAKEDWFEELEHGWFNVAYVIELRDGQRVVLKIAPPAHVEVMSYEREMMQNEVIALRLVADQTSVPVPRVLAVDDSHELCDAMYFFMEFVDAHNLGIVKGGLSPEELDEYNKQLGELNRQLNDVSGSAFGPLSADFSSSDSWRGVFTATVEAVLQDGERKSVELGWDYDRVREAFNVNAWALDEVTRPAFVEWDLWDSNVMVRDGKIVAIIDHERARFGDPLMEAGFVATELPELLGDPAPFLAGYGKAALTDAERTRRRLYNLHLMLIMVIETVYRGHASSDQYDFARSALDTVMASLGQRR